ncbi:MAG: endonuclease/exonuclease/phosphatase family protein [Methylococcaceae bacterium]
MKHAGLRVLTYNIHKGFNVGNRLFVLHQIREALRVADADLLFLQEMQGEHAHREKKIENWPASSQFEFIADGIWPFYAYGKNAIYDAGHHGNAILSKHPFVSWENINVSPFPWASRSLLHGVIQMQGGQDVHIVCIHFGLLGKERRQQIGALCDRIDSHVPHDAPLIVAGDFNDWLGQAERLFHHHLRLKEVFRETHGRYARTFPSWMPFLQMDRIYYRDLKPVSCARLNQTPWYKLSDHAPLVATFTL